jgi:hypothetical protein
MVNKTLGTAMVNKTLDTAMVTAKLLFVVAETDMVLFYRLLEGNISDFV